MLQVQVCMDFMCLQWGPIRNADTGMGSCIHVWSVGTFFDEANWFLGKHESRLGLG